MKNLSKNMLEWTPGSPGHTKGHTLSHPVGVSYMATDVLIDDLALDQLIIMNMMEDITKTVLKIHSGIKVG